MVNDFLLLCTHRARFQLQITSKPPTGINCESKAFVVTFQDLNVDQWSVHPPPFPSGFSKPGLPPRSLVSGQPGVEQGMNESLSVKVQQPGAS